VKQLWDVGLEEYANDMWNVIDFVTNSLYVATVALRVVAYNQVRNKHCTAASTSLKFCGIPVEIQHVPLFLNYPALPFSSTDCHFTLLSKDTVHDEIAIYSKSTQCKEHLVICLTVEILSLPSWRKVGKILCEAGVKAIIQILLRMSDIWSW
jgi:hypothetical protein